MPKDPRFPSLTVVDHPLVASDLARLRAQATPPSEFRPLVGRIASLLIVEATRRLPTEELPVQTPLEATTGRVVTSPVTLVPILRAGLGMLPSALQILPEARVGHLGVRRNEKTLVPEPYYRRLPPGVERTAVFVLDPMLATGGTACWAMDVLKEAGCQDVTLVSLVAAPEGVTRLAARHPEVPVVVAALDRQLDEKGYIRPGLGDAGDRIFGTL